MSWHAQLDLNYRLEAARSVARHQHKGPLRILQSLYPEGDAICHHVLVHPPGGIVGGDELRIDADLGPGTHALITTPGATRFYRSNGATALQDVTLRLAEGARLEWLPLETIAYDGCLAHNRLHATLAPGAEMMGCDILALGLPAADLAWNQGSYRQHVEIADTWLDRSLIRADDGVLLDSGLGWAGRHVLASLWFAGGTPMTEARRSSLVDVARSVIESDEANGPSDGKSAHSTIAGVSAPQNGLVVLRLLGHRVEPVQAMIRAIRLEWRALAWSAPRHTPRIWGT